MFDDADDPKDEEGHWISPGAAKRFRRMSIMLAVFVLVLGYIAFTAISASDAANEALDTANSEVSARVDANVHAIRLGCEQVNGLAQAVKDIIGSQGTVLAPVTAESLGFADPAVTAYVQAIIDRSQGSAQRLREAGASIVILDCEKIAQSSSKAAVER